MGGQLHRLNIICIALSKHIQLQFTQLCQSQKKSAHLSITFGSLILAVGISALEELQNNGEKRRQENTVLFFQSELNILKLLTV